MNNNLITAFFNYKVNCLSEYASFFFDDYKDEFILYNLKSYFETYVNTYYYHILKTLDKAELYDRETIKKELVGKMYELLDEYSIKELEEDNMKYISNYTKIKRMIDIVLFVIEMDKIKYTDKDKISEEFALFINKYPEKKFLLGDKIFKLITRIKDYYVKVNKIFKEEEEYFNLQYIRLNDDETYKVTLKPNIKILETNYKRSMVERVYQKEELTLDKTYNLISKLSKDILYKKLNNIKLDKYLVYIDDNLFYRNKFLLEDEFNNPLIKKYVCLVITYNCYNLHKELIEKMRFNFACIQDLSHINDVTDKLTNIDTLNFFRYILIDKYKEKDLEEIKKFKPNENTILHIVEGE